MDSWACLYTHDAELLSLATITCYVGEVTFAQANVSHKAAATLAGISGRAAVKLKVFVLAPAV